MFVGALIAAAFLMYDGFTHGWSAVSVATRSLWCVFMLVSSVVLLRGSRRAAAAVILASGVVSTLAFLVVVFDSNGLSGPYALWLATFPFALAPYSRRATTASALLIAIGGTWIAWGAPHLISNALSLVLSGVLAVYTSVMFHALRRKERELERERHVDQQKLEASEHRRERSERLALVGQLAAGVAHEINNPLSYVKANLAYLRDEQNAIPEDERAELYDEVAEGLARIAQIVKDLKVFARDPSETATDTDLDGLAQSSVRLAAVRGRAAGVELSIVPSGGLAVARVNPQRLEQVVLNLLLNGIDAVELRPDRRGHVRVRVASTAEGATIEVEDDGPGMSPEVQARLFEPFFTTKPVGKGTGLGLALSREFVHQMGGAISVRTAPGAGTCFTVRVPRTPVQDELPLEPALGTGRYDEQRPLLPATR